MYEQETFCLIVPFITASPQLINPSSCGLLSQSWHPSIHASPHLCSLKTARPLQRFTQCSTSKPSLILSSCFIPPPLQFSPSSHLFSFGLGVEGKSLKELCKHHNLNTQSYRNFLSLEYFLSCGDLEGIKCSLVLGFLGLFCSQQRTALYKHNMDSSNLKSSLTNVLTGISEMRDFFHNCEASHLQH